MQVRYSDDQVRLQHDIRIYLQRLLDPATRESLGGERRADTERRIVRQMGADGWLGVGWPTEWGGRGFTAVEQLIFFDECLRAGAPISIPALSIIGPALMLMGTADQQHRFLPAIIAGDALFAVGYSEPDAGTDLAALSTRAVRDGDHYVIDGEKKWVSFYDTADFLWIAARTDPDLPRHGGLSVLIVPNDAPGLATSRTTVLHSRLPVGSVHFDSVRVPVENRVGDENGGWKVITTALHFERTSLGAPGEVAQLLNDVHHWASTPRNGARVTELPWVRQNLAECYAAVATMQLMAWKLCDEADRGTLDVAHASGAKVFASQGLLVVLRMLMEVVGARAYLRPGSADELLASRLEEMHNHKTILTFGGGNNEVQRELVGTFGLGLPKARI